MSAVVDKSLKIKLLNAILHCIGMHTTRIINNDLLGFRWIEWKLKFKTSK
jgi:hypothetical protein